MCNWKGSNVVLRECDKTKVDILALKMIVRVSKSPKIFWYSQFFQKANEEREKKLSLELLG